MNRTMKLATVLSLNDVLKQIIDNETIPDVSLKFKLLTIAKALENHVLHFQMLRNQKIKEYGQEDDEGTIAIALSDSVSMEKFSADMKALMDTEVMVNLTKLKPEDVFNKGLPSEALVGLYEIIEK